MKIVTYPHDKRTEFVGTTDDSPWVVATQVQAAIAQATGRVLVSLVERQDEHGETYCVVISRPMPRVGQTVKLTVGENAVGFFPAGTGAELIANTEHSAVCPRAHKERADCVCAATLVLRERDAAH